MRKGKIAHVVTTMNDWGRLMLFSVDKWEVPPLAVL